MHEMYQKNAEDKGVRMENQKTILDYDTVALDEAQDAVIIIDQTLLPGKIELIALHTAQEMWDAIYLLKVRGAPAIGVAAALGIYLLANRIRNLQNIRNIWILPDPPQLICPGR